MDNCLFAVSRILNILEVPYTSQYIKELILSHSDYPSILSISDSLNKYKVRNAAVQIEDKNELSNIPTPAIVQIDRSGNPVFCVLNSVSSDTVRFYNEFDKVEVISFQKFTELWTGICLLIEKTEDAKEPGFEKHLYKKNLKYVLLGLMLTSLGTYLFFEWRDIAITFSLIYFIIYASLKLCGIVVGSFLLWFEIDQYNPTLQNLCTGGKKINCNSVLSSRYAKFLKGNVSLSLLSFSYFFAGFFLLLFTSFSTNTWGLLSVFSLGTLPIILFSIYSQAFIIKQWCKFCIAIQLLLALEVLVVLLSISYSFLSNWNALALFGALFVFPVLVWLVLKPILLRSKEAVFYKRNLAKLKFNPDTFFGLLQKSRTIPKVSRNFGIFLESEDAAYTVVKVCNPYCGPCAKAHPVLDTLYKEGKINLQIIFTSTLSEDDFRTPPAKHLLALFEACNKTPEKTIEALDVWYSAKEKNYEIFSKKYPLKEELLKMQDENIKKMRQWCEQTKIQHTPTIFINGYELPEEYSVQDLKEIL